MAEKWTNTSSPPSWEMKPKPFASLNHFTVPFATFLLLDSPTPRGAGHSALDAAAAIPTRLVGVPGPWRPTPTKNAARNSWRQSKAFGAHPRNQQTRGSSDGGPPGTSEIVVSSKRAFPGSAGLKSGLPQADHSREPPAPPPGRTGGSDADRDDAVRRDRGGAGAGGLRQLGQAGEEEPRAAARGRSPQGVRDGAARGGEGSVQRERDGGPARVGPGRAGS